jgi:hypothetical protein
MIKSGTVKGDSEEKHINKILITKSDGKSVLGRPSNR